MLFFSNCKIAYSFSQIWNLHRFENIGRVKINFLQYHLIIIMFIRSKLKFSNWSLYKKSFMASICIAKILLIGNFLILAQIFYRPSWYRRAKLNWFFTCKTHLMWIIIFYKKSSFFNDCNSNLYWHRYHFKFAPKFIPFIKRFMYLWRWYYKLKNFMLDI